MVKRTAVKVPHGALPRGNRLYIFLMELLMRFITLTAEDYEPLYLSLSGSLTASDGSPLAVSSASLVLMAKCLFFTRSYV